MNRQQRRAAERQNMNTIVEQQDFEQVEREYGPLPAGASMEEAARRYYLAVAGALMREYRASPRAKKR